ncbi:hypothetical protein BDEG_22030 [Batrachochytrium dendrobatidis JEL423]|uniref:Chaperone DnaJ C-terminal domain-containing protein n=1 Tax=Batrachochytrium dendrobatidis (strain JEL423) TaxID=403673 RepID=A0A177WE95_BATDL|nr:hypothetical protein BDEG_22030 [Batrachochytrium dendrobatidis JEL423]
MLEFPETEISADFGCESLYWILLIYCCSHTLFIHSEAYEVLSDKQKRSIYDQFGEDGLKGSADAGAGAQGGFPGGFPAGFQSFQSGGFPGGATTFSFSTGPGGAGAGFRPFQPSNADDIFRQFFGGNSPFGSMGMDMDDDIGGMSRGGMPSGFFNMNDASGRGAHTSMRGQNSGRRPAAAVQRTLPVTLEDLYTGAEKRLKVTRKLIDGATARQISTEKILTVNIKPGWKAGTKIKFSGEGDEIPGTGGHQDIEFVVEEKSHAVFKRDGDNLRVTIHATLVEALCGFTRTLSHLDGKSFQVQGAMGNNPIQPGSEIRMPGMGMPISKTPGKKGDLIVTVLVSLPSTLNETQKRTLRQTLGSL